MSILHQMGRALRVGFGLSLVAAFALVNGCASGDVDDGSGPFDESSGGEATENLVSVAPPGQWKCRISIAETMATLVVYPNGRCEFVNGELFGSSDTYCVRMPGGRVCPDCQQLARDFNCAF